MRRRYVIKARGYYTLYCVYLHHLSRSLRYSYFCVCSNLAGALFNKIGKLAKVFDKEKQLVVRRGVDLKFTLQIASGEG